MRLDTLQVEIVQCVVTKVMLSWLECWKDGDKESGDRGDDKLSFAQVCFPKEVMAKARRASFVYQSRDFCMVAQIVPMSWHP